jgi:hypothetical protein
MKRDGSFRPKQAAVAPILSFEHGATPPFYGYGGQTQGGES